MDFNSDKVKVVEADVHNDDEKINSSNRFKRKLIYVTAITATCCLLIMATIIVVYELSNARLSLQLMYTMRAKDTGQVTNISADMDSNVVEYYTDDGRQKVWIVNDFDTSLQTTKIQTGSDSVCYVKAFDTSTYVAPRQMALVTNATSADKLVEFYTISSTPVSDPSKLLGQQSLQMCANIPVYWMYPSSLSGAHQLPEAVSNATAGRSRRDLLGLGDLLQIARSALGSGANCCVGCCYLLCCFGAKGYQYTNTQGQQACQYGCNLGSAVYYFPCC